MKKDGLMEDECNGDMDLGGVKMRYPFPDKQKTINFDYGDYIRFLLLILQFKQINNLKFKACKSSAL